MKEIFTCVAGSLAHSADSSFVPSQWEIAFLFKDVSHWLGASLESAMEQYPTGGKALSFVSELIACKMFAYVVKVKKNNHFLPTRIS